ncbi:hypothetical protein C8R44DRAFT_881925 [Mycena epipterygia]|nr:hypothetical protein C8R44DRAFT_881925 [Mycena epipterygia]
MSSSRLESVVCDRRRVWQSVVRIHPDGTLTERTTGLDVAYLFWEALTNHDVPMTPRGSPPLIQLNLPSHNASRSPPRPAISSQRIQSFSPSTPSRPTSTRRSTNSASTPRVHKLLAPILPQAHSRRAAFRPPGRRIRARCALGYHAPPDVVTRVSMIFKAVAELEAVAGEWKEQAGAGDPALCRNVMGVDAECAGDVGLFRVLEWGRMEVAGR